VVQVMIGKVRKIRKRVKRKTPKSITYEELGRKTYEKIKGKVTKDWQIEFKRI